MRENLLLSDNQDFANTTSTGEVTDNVHNLELTKLAGVIPITDDQGMGYMNVTLNTVPAQATIAGTQGLIFEVRTDAAAALTTLPEICGAVSVIPTKLLAGAKFSVPFRMDVLQTFIGGWVRAYNTAVVGTIYADIHFSDTPISPNESIQKSPA
uniref:Uncharacterized protein n=1 Tax=viral metagenome TaxID=1070528 RepID=A0A6M3JC36_9ZZZZ